MKIETKFNINDAVKIEPLNIEGDIKCITFDKSNISYRVKYYINNEQKIEWFDENELSLCTINKIGFND